MNGKSLVSDRSLIIHAAALHVGGGWQVGMNLSRALIESGAFRTIDIIAPIGHGYEEFAGENVIVHALPKKGRFFRTISVARDIERSRDNPVLLNLCNVGIPVSSEQYLLIHRPHHLYPYRDAMAMMPLSLKLTHQIKHRLLLTGLRWVKKVLVQTEFAQQQFAEKFGDTADLLPNAVPHLPALAEHALVESDGRFRVLYLTRYYPHKNLETVMDLIESLGPACANYHFIFTLDGLTGKKEERLLERMAPFIQQGYITNLGRVEHANLPALFASADALLMPTLLESFSTTYAEAMHFGVPIVTSDRGFARSVCRDGAIYVDAWDYVGMAKELEHLRTDPVARDALIANGRSVVEAMPSWSDCAGRFIKSLDRAQDAN